MIRPILCGQHKPPPSCYDPLPVGGSTICWFNAMEGCSRLMAELRPLRGLRYRGAAAHDLGRLIAPPYDTVPGTLPNQPRRHPFNIAQLEDVLPEGCAVDANPHDQAAARYRQWRRDGTIGIERDAAFYLHEQRFTDRGQPVVRRAVLGRVRLADWTERVILPHERTFPRPVAERLARLRAVHANLSPIYLLAADADDDLRSVLADAATMPATMSGRDPAGAGHRLTVLTDAALTARLTDLLAPHQLFVADGHHRYEAALAFRDERRAATAGSVDPDAGAEFVLALIAPIGDEGVRVLPTHRVIANLPTIDPVRFRAGVSEWFDLVPCLGDNAVVVGDDPLELCRLRFAGDHGCWSVRRRPGEPHRQVLPGVRSAAWQRLDVAVVQQIIIERVLGLEPERLSTHLTYTPDVAAVEQALHQPGANLAILLAPPRLTDLLAVAAAGETLPPKATYFHPKAPAGLVINDLDEPERGGAESP